MMKPLKYISTLSLVFLLTGLSYGQPPKRKGDEPNKEKIKAMKVGYITEKLALTTEEAQKFWPIYNEFQDKIEDIHKQLRKMQNSEESIDDMSDAEVEKMVDMHTELRQKELDIQKEYHAKFKAVLPIKKVAKLYKADQDFMRDLLKKIKNHKGSGQGGHDGPPPPPGRPY